MKLSTRIAIVMGLVVLLTGLASGLVSIQTLQEEMRNEQHEWARLLTSSLAESLAADTINGNTISAQQILFNVRNSNNNIEHMYIVDFDGKIFAHTFKTGFPEQLLGHSQEAHDYIRVALDGRDIEEIAIPLIEGMDATLQIGISGEVLNRAISASIRRTITIYTLIGAIAIALSYFMSRRISSPLEQLDIEMRDYAESGNTDKISVHSDIVEASNLVEAFNQVIEARQTAETALSKTEQDIKLLLDSTGEAIFGVDTEGRCTFANPACARMTGYDSPNELLGKNMHELLHHSHVDGSHYPVDECPIYNSFVTGGKAHSDKEMFWCKDGTGFPVEYSAHPIISNGEVIGTVVTFNDISERIESARALNQFKSTLDKTSDCVFMFKADDSLKFIYANKGATDQIGYNLDEMMGMTPYDIKPCFTEEQFRSFIAPMLKGESDFEFFETTHRHKDGHDIPVEIGLQYIGAPDEEARFVAVVRDISERKRVEAELTRHRDNLEELVEERTLELHNAQDELVRKERLATLGQLTATVSHELRNPLGAMRPSLYIIEKKTQQYDDEKLQSAIERVNRNISRCDRIIDELLDFTRITGLDLGESNLDDWLNTLVQEQPVHDDIAVDWQPGLGDYVANIDFDRFRRAIINVVENGCHAMLEADDATRIIPDARLTIRSFQDNERINIQITDTGSGIPDDVLPQIFTPLYSTKGFGVGLGMPTVKQIMEQHAGGIDIETRMGQGTTTTLWLPLNRHKEVTA